MSTDRDKPESYWKEKLSDEQYRVLRQAGTERPFTGEYDEFDEPGTYKCAACGQELFTSKTKFHSGCGWPSFFDSIEDDKIEEVEDLSHGMRRVEVRCANCGSHLGHVFPDGPEPTGLRYCINSVALDFDEAND